MLGTRNLIIAIAGCCLAGACQYGSDDIAESLRHGICTHGHRVQPADLTTYLNQHETIRVYIPASPKLGHQSAAVTVMDRLRELGFEGTYEITYDRYGSSSGLDALQTLLTNFNPQDLNHCPGPPKTKVIPIDEIDLQGPKTALTVAGGADSSIKYLANRVHTEKLLFIQVLAWGYPGGVFADNEPTPFDDELAKLPIWHPNLRDNSISISDWIAGLYRCIPDPRGTQKHALSTLTTLLSRRHAVMPVYGEGLNGSLVATLAQSVSKVQQKDASKFPEGAVILVTDSLDVESVDRFLRGIPWNGVPKPVVIRADDPATANQLRDMKPNQTTVVITDPIVKPVLEEIHRKAELPLVYEGRSSWNLALCLGKPRLRINGDGAAKDFAIKMPGQGVAFVDTLINAEKAMKALRDSRATSEEPLVEFISQAIDENSELSRYFKSIVDFGNPPVDRVYKAVEMLMARGP